MTNKILPVLLLLCVAFSGPLLAVAAEQLQSEDMCHGMPDNHLIPDPESCKSFYICRGAVAVKEICSPSFWYDPTRSVCALPGPYCRELACIGLASVFAADPKECGVYHFCAADAILYSGACNDGLTFYPSTQTCTYPHCWETQGGAEDKINLSVESVEEKKVGVTETPINGAEDLNQIWN